MRTEPKSILYFLYNYIDIIQLLLETQGEGHIIRRETLAEICKEAGHDIESKLIEYKILKKINDDYTFNIVFHDLLNFIFQEFKPALPQTIGKYSFSIGHLFFKVRENINGDKTILSQSINNLMTEINGFVELIDRNTLALLTETRQLKANLERIGYRDKVLKASRWVEEFILPMNEILDVNQSQSIANRLYDISLFANQRRLNFLDENIRQQFEQLYTQLIHSNDELLRQSKILTNELIPLIERIRTESMILSGWIEFLKNPYKVKTPNLLLASRDVTYQKNIYLNTLEYFQQFEDEEDIILDDSDTKSDKWIFNKPLYKEKLKEHLPVDNFFKWCASTLKDEYKLIEVDKFFSLLSLMFEEDISFEPEDGKKSIEIRTSKTIFKAPKIKAYANLLS